MEVTTLNKIMAMVLCLVLVFSFVGCGSKDKQHKTTIQIGEVIYYNTEDAVPVKPDESVIVDAHPSKGDEIEAYAIMNPGDSDEMLVGLIDGEWYKFLPKAR